MSSPRHLFAAPRKSTTTSIDSLDVVIGDDVLLVSSRPGSVHLYAIEGEQRRSLGSFTDAGSAWMAIDALESAGGDAGRMYRAA